MSVCRRAWGPRGGRHGVCMPKPVDPLSWAFLSAAEDLGLVFYIFSGCAFDAVGGGQRPTMMAKELMRRGYAVFFIEGYPSMLDPVLPERYPLLRLCNANDYQLLDQAWDWGVRHVSIFGLPSFEFSTYCNLALFHGHLCFYDCLDNWSAFSLQGDASWYEDDFERLLVCRCHYCLASSRRLAGVVAGFGGRAVVFPNAVDLGAFAKGARHVPTPLKVDGLKLLFWGHAYEGWVDFGLVAEVTSLRSGWQWFWLGDASDTVLRRFEQHHFVGVVPHEDLVNWGCNVDVCIIPFKGNEVSAAVNPLKAYEYLACYKPVVVVNCEEVAGMPFVWGVSGAGEFVEAVERASKARVEGEVVDRFLNEHTWGRRVDGLLSLVDEGFEKFYSEGGERVNG